MKGFQKIEEDVRSVLKSLIEEYGFSIMIDEYQIKLKTEDCKILITTEHYYPDIRAYIINLNATGRDTYMLESVMKLRQVPFTKLILDSEKDDDDDCRLEELTAVNKELKLCCFDMMKGDFTAIQREGYWEMPEIKENLNSSIHFSETFNS